MSSLPKIVLLIALAIAQCQGQSWADFQRKHVLDPAVDSGYSGWNRASWNTWLRNRIPSDYGSKNVNSVVVKQPTSLLNDFKFTNPGHSAGPDFHWSSIRLSTYVMQLVSGSGTYDAYRCPAWYVLARLDASQRPMHYHGYADSQPATGSLPLNLGSCTKIN
ncbi:uncharacterized protein LOC110844761 [Folsomia candida]|uniref:Uncharacterized protein n=1 Tax=Folsomia candida TaxID=158441 RepID=A0A226EUR1_FOLCA|nr:uncharacterized protein LOC110844761 [Folsomia candida]OXA60356.1 hypothetical protein Fcan01_04751 [Folsomia candida]